MTKSQIIPANNNSGSTPLLINHEDDPDIKKSITEKDIAQLFGDFVDEKYFEEKARLIVSEKNSLYLAGEEGPDVDDIVEKYFEEKYFEEKARLIVSGKNSLFLAGEEGPSGDYIDFEEKARLIVYGKNSLFLAGEEGPSRDYIDFEEKAKLIVSGKNSLFLAGEEGGDLLPDGYMIMDEIIFNKLKWIKIKVPNGDILYFEDISAVQHYIAGKENKFPVFTDNKTAVENQSKHKKKKRRKKRRTKRKTRLKKPACMYVCMKPALILEIKQIVNLRKRKYSSTPNPSKSMYVCMKPALILEIKQIVKFEKEKIF